MRAWLNSALIALAVPLPVWFAFQYWGSPLSERFSPLFLAIVGVASLVHLLAYVIFGMPIFLRFYRNAESPIWKLHNSLALGFLLGIVAMLFTLLCLRYSAHTFSNPQVYLTGGAYGLVSALSAYLVRPNTVEQGGDPKTDPQA